MYKSLLFEYKTKPDIKVVQINSCHCNANGLLKKGQICCRTPGFTPSFMLLNTWVHIQFYVVEHLVSHPVLYCCTPGFTPSFMLLNTSLHTQFCGGSVLLIVLVFCVWFSCVLSVHCPSRCNWNFVD